jgi:hypothetical protein
MVLVSAIAALAVGTVGAVGVWSAVAYFLPTLVAEAFELGSERSRWSRSR